MTSVMEEVKGLRGDVQSSNLSTVKAIGDVQGELKAQKVRITVAATASATVTSMIMSVVMFFGGNLINHINGGGKKP